MYILYNTSAPILFITLANALNDLLFGIFTSSNESRLSYPTTLIPSGVSTVGLMILIELGLPTS